MIRKQLIIVGACIAVMAGVSAYAGVNYHRLMDPIYEAQNQYLLQFDDGGSPGQSLDDRVNAIYATNPSTTMVRGYTDIHAHHPDMPLGEFYGRVYKTLLVTMSLVGILFVSLTAEGVLAYIRQPKKVEKVKAEN